MYIYIYIYQCVCTYICICTNVYVHIYMYKYVYIYIQEAIKKAKEGLLANDRNANLGASETVFSPQRDLYCIAEQPAPAPQLAHPEGCAALRIVQVTVPRVSHSCEQFWDEFDLHLLQFLHTLDLMGCISASTERI